MIPLHQQCEVIFRWRGWYTPHMARRVLETVRTRAKIIGGAVSQCDGGRGGRPRDDSWDYCSPQSSSDTGKSRTRYNKPCKNACASRGENYFWCDTWDDTWEYCSPKAEKQQVVVRKGQQNYPCDGICDKRGDSNKWCTVVSVADAKIKV